MYEDQPYTLKPLNSSENDNNFISNKPELRLLYTFSSVPNRNNSFVYHKIEKWFAYISHNLIVIENFQQEQNRSQRILSHSQDKLSALKISSNNKILYAYTKPSKHTFILFYSYNPIKDSPFTLINKCNFNHNEITDCEMSHKNNMCIVLTKTNNITFVSLLDFFNNEILVTSAVNSDYSFIKWNVYLVNLEFTTIGKQSITFWRINSSDGSLQYQEANFNTKKELNQINGEILTCVEFFKFSNVHDIVLMLVGSSYGKVFVFDTKTNSFLYKFENIKKGLNGVKLIFYNGKYLNFVFGNELKSINCGECDIKKYKNGYEYIKSLTLQTAYTNEFSFDSEIMSIDYDKHSKNDEAIVLSSKGLLYYVNYVENATIKIFHFLIENSPIIQLGIIRKTYDKYEIKNNFDSFSESNNSDDDIDDNNNKQRMKVLLQNYFIITAHKNGSIKIWSIPEYILLYNFETINESIITFDTAKNNFVFCVSYSTNTVRLFNNHKVVGKFKSHHLDSYSNFNYVKFLPDEKYLFLIDSLNSMFLVYIEKFEPLMIQYHTIMKLKQDIISFNLSVVESYNIFYFNIQNVYLLIYNRKFTNLMKQTSYEGTVPQFYMQEKFHLPEYFSQFVDNNNNHLLKGEKYQIEFSTNSVESKLIYIFSQATRVLVARNFETHVIEKLIDFKDNILGFNITYNFKYIILLYGNKIQISTLEKVFNYNKSEHILNDNSIETKYESQVPLIKVSNDYIVTSSDNSRYLVLYNNESVCLYKI